MKKIKIGKNMKEVRIMRGLYSGSVVKTKI